jgi:hypothetical protein
MGAALLCAAMNAHAIGGVADVEIINRDTGEVLKVYRHGGEYWVAGQPGARYAISVHNRLGQRVLAVMAVDGINVISGKTAAVDQDGYVFNAEEQYSIYGWRKSNKEVADFNFTALPDSYAARTGRPENVGVIGVALFTEKRALPQISEDAERRAEAGGDALLEESVVSGPRGQSAPAAPSSVSPRQSNIARLGAEARAEKLGTGHGPREVSLVVDTRFDRQSSSPNEVVRIRYDRLENLVAMGVVPPHRYPDGVPNAFPDSPRREYVPDPPSGL